MRYIFIFILILSMVNCQQQPRGIADNIVKKPKQSVDKAKAVAKKGVDLLILGIDLGIIDIPGLLRKLSAKLEPKTTTELPDPVEETEKPVEIPEPEDTTTSTTTRKPTTKPKPKPKPTAKKMEPKPSKPNNQPIPNNKPKPNKPRPGLGAPLMQQPVQNQGGFGFLYPGPIPC